MAIVYEGYNGLKEKVEQQKAKKQKMHKNVNVIGIIVLLAFMFAAILAFVFRSETFYILLGSIPTLGAVVMLCCWGASGSGQIESLGLLGENKTLRLLSERLDEETTVFYSINVPDTEDEERRPSQLDFIVVSAYGIFIVENKHITGLIAGEAHSKTLTQTKISPGNNEYTNSMANPIRQVGTHVYRLSNYLRRHNINVFIQGVVFFSNSNSTIDIKIDKIPVFNRPDALMDFLNSGTRKISTGTQMQIVNAIKALL